MDNGHAQKGAVTLFTGGREILEFRVGVGLIEVNRLFSGGNHTHQALIHGQAHVANGFRV